MMNGVTVIEAVGVVLAGLVILTYGADKFVDAASAAGRNSGITPLIVGLVVVGFATSAPEMLVATVASIQGRPDIAVGNALGSNIANVGLVIGVTALITPLAVHSRVLLREFPIMLFCMIVALVACLDGALQRVDGAVLGIGLVVMMVGITWLGIKGKREDALVVEIEHHQTAVMTTRTAVTWLVIGIALLLLGSNLLVEGSVVIARHFGMSDLVIGLTIVAVGTSLPELAASVASAWKGEPEIALGNVIGSNMFNILGVLAVPALIHPTVLEPEILARDMPMMFGLSLFLYAVAYSRDLHGTVTRLAGAFLLAGFCGYQWWLVVAGGA